jgi:hypothetical protein
MVPRSVLEAWEAQRDKQLEMIEVLRGHYARRKNKPITEGISCELEFTPQRGDSLFEIVKKLENRELKKRVLELLKYREYRAWHLSPINKLFRLAVMMAAHDGDAAFFKALGERLKKPCGPTLKLSELRSFLLLNWIDTEVCFCWFSDRALLDFIKLTEKDGAPFTMDAIRQERERLGLPKLKPALVRSIKQDGKRILLNGAKPPRTSAHSIVGLTLADYLPDETETRKRMQSAAAKTKPGSKEKCCIATNMEWRQPIGRRRRRPRKRLHRK